LIGSPVSFIIESRYFPYRLGPIAAALLDDYSRELQIEINSVFFTAESDTPRMVYVGESPPSVSFIAGTRDDTECFLSILKPDMNRNEHFYMDMDTNKDTDIDIDTALKPTLTTTPAADTENDSDKDIETNTDKDTKDTDMACTWT
jgi:hypothetical protein